MPRLPKLSLSLTFWNGLLLSVVVGAVLIASQRSTDELGSRVQEDQALRAAEAVSLTFSKAIEREWESIRAVASQVDASSYEGSRRFVDAVLSASSSVSWAGIANASGIVFAGAGGAREGEDVSQRRWFREGLRDENAGSVFRPEGQDERGFINLSVPIYNEDGEASAVVVYRIGMAWVEAYVGQTADALDVDLYVINAANEVLVQRERTFEAALTEREITSARLRANRGLIVATPEGSRFTSATKSNMVGRANPPMGWSLVVRVPYHSPEVLASRELGWPTVFFLTAAAAVLGCLALINGLIARPIASLAACAENFSKGEVTYPAERVNTIEAEQLSGALSALQTQQSNEKRRRKSKSELLGRQLKVVRG
ncbi:cache domain-containing protein [Roseivivax marinus]|nr:cache domain-containing protein [Roseivivax marinus]